MPNHSNQNLSSSSSSSKNQEKETKPSILNHSKTILVSEELEIEPLFLPESETDDEQEESNPINNQVKKETVEDQDIQIISTNIPIKPKKDHDDDDPEIEIQSTQKPKIKSTSILDQIIPIGEPSKLDLHHSIEHQSKNIKPKIKKQLELDEDLPTRANKKIKISSPDSDIEITHWSTTQIDHEDDDHDHDSPSWKRQYLGGFMSEGFMVYSGAKLAENEQIKLVRSRPISTSTSGAKVFKSNTNKPDYVVRVESQKNGHFARLNESFGQWIVPLIDHKLCEFEGNLVFPPENPRSGDTVQFYIKVYITRAAFGPADQLSNRHRTYPNMKSQSTRSFTKPYKADNPEDQANINRQQSLIKLFEIIDLKPIQQINTNGSSILKSKSSKVFKAPLSQDGSTISQSQLKSVYHQANLKLEDIEPPSASQTLHDGFKLELRTYQEQGLNWLLTMETLSEETNSIHPLWDQYKFPKEEGTSTTESPPPLEPFYFNSYMGCFTLQFPHSARKSRGGILADEMGLGKTIQMAALICTAKPQKEDTTLANLDTNKMKEDDDEDEKIDVKRSQSLTKAPVPVATLVICPLTLLNQWQDELERCDPTLRVSIFHSSSHGKNVPEDPTQGGEYDVVITTYGIVATEWAELDGKGMFDPNKKKKPITSGLFSVEWHRIILDEAHTIKNRNARTTKACCELKSLRRWCLTGTPIVNRLDDLASLLHFVKLEPWGDFSFFKSFVTIPFSKGDPKAVEVVQVIIESTVLRREKSMKDRHGRLIVGDLPPKTIEIKSLKMNEKESKIYEMMFKNAKAKFMEVLMAGTVMKNFTMILTILIRLRQIVLHPTIVVQRVGEEFFHKLIRNVDQEEEKSLKCLIRDYGRNDWNESGTDLKKKIKKLEKVLKKKRSEEEAEVEECSICLDFIDSRVFLPCMHSFCKACIMEYVESKMGEETMCANCNQVFVETELIEYVGKKRKPKKMICPSSTASSEASTQIDEEMQVDEFVPDQEDDEDEEGIGGYLKSNHGFISSTKLEALVEDLIEVRRLEPEFSAVVFSQFNDFLNLLENVLERDRFRFVRLDGKLTQKKRKAVLKTFNYPVDKGCILLCSLKVAGVGLNLIKANRVYMMDTWWNGAIEDQAIDRVHRFGQTKETKVTRYVMSDSIEERMVELQEKKREIVKRAFATSGPDGKKSKQTLQDLEAIFAD